MWPFTGCGPEADSCTPRDPNAVTPSTILSLVPLLGIFITAHVLASRHLFPRLNRSHDDPRDGEGHVLPHHAPAALRAAHAEHGAKSAGRRAAAAVFGVTLGLTATLGALILAEILGVVDPAARGLALWWTVRVLLLMLVVVLPWMECRSLVASAGWSFQPSSRGRAPRAAWAAQGILFGAWLCVFWCVGKALPTARTASRPGYGEDGLGEMLIRACLERVGVVGISLMALLAGFASVSSPWYTFGDASARRRRPVTEADVTRRQAGLDATSEMLLTKRHRLQMLERKASEPSQGVSKSGFMGKMMGSIRGASGDEAEMRSLRVEIAGLESMEASLASSLSLMKGHRDAAARASTPVGRILLVPAYIFSCYCIYRVLATMLTTLRRLSSPTAASSFSSSDPINRFLGLLARHWDPKLDQLAWARTISFALSGVVLLLSANSVVQTLRLFSRWAPPALHRRARGSLALAAGQVAATYVISSALLLRSHLPGEVSSTVSGALVRGAPLMSPAFADGWFEGWFLVGALGTGLGLWVGRSVAGGGGGGVAGGDDFYGEDYGMEEMGAKRS
ncbi:Golgi pH regulator-like protein [Hapsidospora chrysogenum ATCC 11550]|uniref:Golgi pH regulator-like protein n=1 Tax=Hapsidospora chrysogenum (strain ATCC 11550 / CBS 779.69 / DSM 880 / IAM 14645 / JCM 23072 / IMI 49137) TaxID=857340 RepID=A0A086SZH6_HAPC1|nr:Golgi pH regulator-like protein [Hapsidospora chrysogenum ATCC 11550]